MQGRIIKSVSGTYTVSYDDQLYDCKARGKFRHDGISPLVGDMVTFELTDNGKGMIDEILPRRNFLYRPPVANIDKLFILSSYTTPAPNAEVIDRLTAIAVYNGIQPIIVFNKCDMGDFEEWNRIYTHAGFKTYTISAATKEGIDEIRHEYENCVCALTGNSGVGKSSLLNALFPDLDLKTGDVSEKLGRGRHTTRHTELYRNSYGGYIADTPGFSAIENDAEDYEFKEKLPECFPDFQDYIYNCRFSSCTHTCEKGCSVIEAVKNGQIEPSRHKSYLTLFEEMKEIKPWNSKKK